MITINIHVKHTKLKSASFGCKMSSKLRLVRPLLFYEYPRDFSRVPRLNWLYAPPGVVAIPLVPFKVY